MSSSPASVQPGWYDDPQTPGTLRWHDGEAWSPFTRAADMADRPAPTLPRARTAEAPGVTPAPAPTRPSTTTALAARPGLDRTGPAAEWAPAADRAPAAVPTPHRDPAPTWPAAPTTEPPAAAGRPAPAAPTPAGLAHAASPAPAAPALPASLPPTAPTRPAALPPSTGSGLRPVAGRLAARLPGWLPTPVSGPLSRRLARAAAAADRPREGVAGLARRVVFPADGAWQASAAALLGLLTVALAVWPLVGAGAWLVTCAFAGLAFRRLRRDVLLGGMERAWFGIACGIAPLWTGLLALTFR